MSYRGFTTGSKQQLIILIILVLLTEFRDQVGLVAWIDVIPSSALLCGSVSSSELWKNCKF
ncbi:hypothetical protein DK2RH_06395 [Rickettsia helvetica]